MELRYATITGVARDDLDDGGAWLYAETVRAIHELNPGTGVENLIPDFNGKPDLLREVFESAPEVLAHNVETVPRIFKRIRPAFRYDRSLDVITQARDFGLVTKSNLILGMGETREEVSQALRDLHDAGCELITITQYLRPSRAPPPGRALGQARGVRRAARPRPRRSASPACCPDRWCVRRTAPVGCTVRRWTPARARPPDPARPSARPDAGTSAADDGRRTRSPSTRTKMSRTPAVRRDLPDDQEVRPAARAVDPRLVPPRSARIGFAVFFWLLPTSGILHG